MHFRKYILVYTLLPLVVLTLAASYFRFMVALDYTVFYEGDCDPHKSDCFVGCEDDSCDMKYYYTQIERHAQDFYNLCGEDVAQCDYFNVCTIGEEECTISYCNSPYEDCDTFDNIDIPNSEVNEVNNF